MQKVQKKANQNDVEDLIKTARLKRVNLLSIPHSKIN